MVVLVVGRFEVVVVGRLGVVVPMMVLTGETGIPLFPPRTIKSASQPQHLLYYPADTAQT